MVWWRNDPDSRPERYVCDNQVQKLREINLHVWKKMAAVAVAQVCETTSCNNEAKLQCPTCIKLGIQGSYFCNQVIFNLLILSLNAWGKGSSIT